MQDVSPMRDGTKALKILREKILRLELSPGAVIDENTLASALSLSRTPIREAIIQLIAEGLAIRDGRVARVAPLNFDDVPRLYDALLVASRMVQRLAAANRTEADLRRIQETFEAFEEQVYSGDDMQRQNANVDFHIAIARAAHNDHFFDFYQKVLTASSRLSRACFAGADPKKGQSQPVTMKSDPELYEHVTKVSQQHRQMVEAISSQDVEGADRLAFLHQDLALNRIQRLLFSRSDAIRAVALADA